MSIAKNFIRAYNNALLPVPAANNPIPLNNIDLQYGTGTLITYNPGTSTFTVPPGKYTLLAGFPRLSGINIGTSSDFFGFYNVTTSSFIGCAFGVNNHGVTTAVGGGMFTAILNNTVTTQIQARVIVNQLNGNFDPSGGPESFFVQIQQI